MEKGQLNAVPGFLHRLGMDEEPMGMFFTNSVPEQGFAPKPAELPTREKEMRNQVDWQGVFSKVSCVMGSIWLARKKKSIAYFSTEQFGCPGGAFWLGFNKPQAETIIRYVSTGIPGKMEGECYCDSPDNLRRIFEFVDPIPAPGTYCVFKPLSLFTRSEVPVLVSFFARPESMSALHQLATFVTNDPEVVASPWSAACGSLAAWPLRYLAKGEQRAVVGGWDPSARKFFKTDELSFTVPFAMFEKMLARYQDSFLNQKTWDIVRKKINMSKKAWNEI